MRTFIFRVLIFFSPILILVISFLILDVFKLFGTYANYYKNSFITLNRDFVSTQTYEKYRESEGFNSFIFGSSRSQAFKCSYWEKYLDENAHPFHYDASNETLYGIANKVRYIAESDNPMDNALIILDRTILRGFKNKDYSHLFISDPRLSKASRFKFYWTFLKVYLNPKFIAAYFDYRLFGVHRGYMSTFVRKAKYEHEADPITGDMWYGYDKHIQKDSIGYYDALIQKGVFYERPVARTEGCKVDKRELKLLKMIKTAFDQQKTNCKIVISPIYDQLSMEEEQLELLRDVFGTENVFDFSGENDLTEPIENYYETSHYRPCVANKIMDRIY